MTTSDSSLFARLGGAEAIEAVTAEFYRRVLADPLLAPHFDGVDMARQAGMLTAFLALATGGTEQYRGRDLRAAHADLKIGDDEFDAVVTHLGAALTDAGVSDSLIAEVVVVAASVRKDVLGY